MSTAHGRGPLGDDDLARALSQGLSRRLDGDIDTAALLRGARDGARRIERRRTVVKRGVVTLVVAAMLPVGVGFVRQVGFGGGSSAGGSAVSAPEAAAASSAAGSADDGGLSAGGGAASTSSSAAAAGTEKNATEATPGPATAVRGLQFSVKDGALVRDAGEVVVPDVALLRADDLGLSAATVTADTGSGPDRARTTVTTVVPLCGTGPAEAAAQGGRTVSWTGPAQGRGGWSVATAVRVFAGTGAADETTRLRRTVGTCAGSAGVSRETIAGLPGDDVLVAVLPTDPSGGLPVVGLLRRGRVTVGVEVVVPPSSDPAADRADGVARVRALLTRADARVAGFAAAAAQDSSLG